MNVLAHPPVWRAMHSLLVRADVWRMPWGGACRTAMWLRAKELDKKAGALGRKLAKGLETDEEEEEEEDCYDTSEIEASGIIFSPVKRYPWHAPLSCPCLGPGVENAGSWGIPVAHGSLLWQNVRKLPSLLALDRVCCRFPCSHYLLGFLLLPLVGTYSGPC